MSNQRIEKLQRLAGQKPNDPFPLYALALEYRKEALEEGAERYFQKLIDEHPGYVPVYFQFGQFLVDLGREDEATTVLRNGREVAREQGDSKAESEIEALLDTLA